MRKLRLSLDLKNWVKEKSLWQMEMTVADQVRAKAKMVAVAVKDNM